MKPDQQVPRNALVWMVICLFTLVAPHALRIPLWVLVVYAVAVLWRVMVYRGRWSFPGWRAKLALILTAFGGIYFSYRSLIGLEPTVALLLTAFALKLTELAERKDAYVLLFLGYFIIVTEFLFSQDLLVVAYCFFSTIVVTTALVALHRPGEHQFNRRTIGLASVMIFQALPLMLVLFFLFPRIGPLWSVPLKSQSGKTGMSDFMKPGDVSRLSQSSEVAFRVNFDGEIPPRAELYWRGLVFSKLVGGVWSSLRYTDVPVRERRPAPVDTSGQPLRYSVIMEPTQQHWLYGLRYAKPATTGVLERSDYRLFSPVEVEDELLYEVRSWPEAILDESLSDWRREIELRVPEYSNPRTLELAREMRARSGSDRELVDAVLTMFNQQPFVYTLQPPLLGDENPIDRFLFTTRRGFCEHYAHAFTLMMRAAGVPARVVAGYQGGEVNPVNGTVIVHQFDAHAWSEIWLEGEGWVRVDPTAAVAPERIELGLEQAVAEEGSFLVDSPLSPLRYRGINWVNQIRLRYDALTYRWQSWVVGFDSERQFQLMHDWFGGVSARKFALLLIGTWALVLVPVAVALLLRRRTHPIDPLDKAYLQFCQRLERFGVQRHKGEAPGDFGRRAAAAVPALAAQIEQITGAYSQLVYAAESVSAGERREAARELLREVRRVR